MEQLLHYAWKHKILPLHPLQTTTGQQVEVIDPGLQNANAGPDFFNAKLKVDGILWAGNIEIHRCSSDWYRHHHDTNPAYDSVILHLATEIDTEIRRTNGELIPQMQFSCPDSLIRNYQQLLSTDRYPACFETISRLPKLQLHSWLNTLQIERFEQKTNQVFTHLVQSGQHWEDAFFITLARNFGFGVNGDAFERWARSLPMRAIDKHRDSLLQIEAFFFGQAGLLEIDATDEYTRQLQQEYRYLQHKFQLPQAPAVNWNYLRMRPNNFPHIRIAQLACLYHRSQGLFSQIMETDSLKQLCNLLKGGTSDYWRTHYHFGITSESRPKTLTSKSINLLIINTVVSYLYAYGKHKKNDGLCLRAGKFLEELPAEDNYIIRMWQNCGITPQHAADSQALIQLKKNYCDVKKCLYCRIGFFFLKSSSK